MNVTILLVGNGLTSTAIGPREVFRWAGVLWNNLTGKSETPLFKVYTASQTGEAVYYEGGISLTPDRKLSSLRQTDLIIVPAIGMEIDQAVAENQSLIKWLRRRYNKGTAVAGICTGVALLAEAGILDGKPATTHWGVASWFQGRYPQVDWQPERFITEADNVYCSGGLYSALDLSLYLVEKYAGYETASQCAKALLIDSPRKWQTGYAPPFAKQAHGDEKIEAAQRYLHEHRHEPVKLDELAQQLGMSPRNFARRFSRATGEGALNYLHKLRVTEAKKLLENDFMTVQQVCYEVGYEDLAFFRNIFKRYTGMPPTEYRRRFGRERYTLIAPEPQPGNYL